MSSTAAPTKPTTSAFFNPVRPRPFLSGRRGPFPAGKEALFRPCLFFGREGASGEKILVPSVGTILFTDEGTGVRAVELARERYVFPDNVTLLDGGTLGMGLMDALLDCDVVFVLDAVLGGDEPGSIYRLTGDDLRKSVSFRDSMHQTDLVDTLVYCDLMGHRPEAVVVGMEPVDYRTVGTELSPLAAERLPLLLDVLIRELKARGVDATPRPSA